VTEGNRYPRRHREGGAPLPPIVMWFQIEEEEGIRTNLHNPWRSGQKRLKLRRRKVAKPMQIKGPMKKTDRRRKRKTEFRE